jgi:CRISPR-associated protein Cas5t
MTPALRIEAEGVATSFRYPHFPHGVQPTYPMPPPATIYGHVCSTLGERVPPDSFRFALHFVAQGRFFDYEHIHLFGAEAKLSPFEREMLFQPRLTLYLDRPDWAPAFRSPAFVVTLGRSQDLMRYRAVEVIGLQPAAAGYLDCTYLPLAQAQTLAHRTALMMARSLDERRSPEWEQYAMVSRPQPWDVPCLCDAHAPQWQGRGRAIVWNALSGHVTHS